MIEDVLLKARALGISRVPIAQLTPQQRYRLKCSSPLYEVDDVVFVSVDRMIEELQVIKPDDPEVTIECSSEAAMTHASKSLKYSHYWVLRGEKLVITNRPTESDEVLEYVECNHRCQDRAAGR